MFKIVGGVVGVIGGVGWRVFLYLFLFFYVFYYSIVSHYAVSFSDSCNRLYSYQNALAVPIFHLFLHQTCHIVLRLSLIIIDSFHSLAYLFSGGKKLSAATEC